MSPVRGETPAHRADNCCVVTGRIRVAIVEDQPLFRDLLASGLEDYADLEIALCVGTVQEARSLIPASNIDVAVLDVELPDGNGIGLGAGLKRQQPSIGIVTLSMLDMLEPFLSMDQSIRVGWSYLLKTSANNLETVVSAIRQSVVGASVIDPELAMRSKPRVGSAVAMLTPRQFEVLRLVARGDSNEAIAGELGIAENSVVNHLTAIYATLGIMDGKNARVSATLEFLSNTQRH